ncbi:ABC transporter permease [Roseivirga echinicomitans]|uniref:ABC3 transporter permease protein domain-containing protein n=1 Tax=Roseivirga echinicomitans TaxID=296218 RepID=A0A150XX82_9BACT|nr:ABC transporter permease [Roseivirga echinicomitans]KYG83235.1 hypothetical protein AWN68_00020 [Roseivirga echinicomitans]
MDSYKNPPRWALRLLQEVCPSDIAEEVEGDLFEAYQWRLAEKGQNYAKRKYIFEVLRCLRYYRIKVRTQNSSVMLIQNYFKTGLRFLWKTKGYSSLNIFGLALGIAISWLAYIFVSDEYSFDAFYPNASQIYRTTASISFNDNTDNFAGASYIMGEELPRQVPEIIHSSRFKNGSILVKFGEEYFNQVIHYADPDFFEMFSVPMVVGNHGAFTDPSSVVISESVAKRMGIESNLSNAELITTNGSEEARFNIVGIYKDFPQNTSIRPQVLFPFSYWANNNQERLNTWFDINMNVFFQLDEQSSADQVSEKITKVLLLNEDFDQAVVGLQLQALTDIHLDPNLSTGNGVSARGDNQQIVIIITIGIFCLLISCVNYANFAVGNYQVRLKEVALRKVFGAKTGSVFKQFITEAFISTFLALVISVLFIYLILPGFASYANKQYDLNMVFNSEMLIGGLTLMLVATILAGLYPALLLARYKMVHGLKGKAKLGGKNYLSRGLISLQFAISVFLIAGMLTMNKQLNFMLNQDIGYHGENVIKLFRPIDDEQAHAAFKNDLLKISGVENVSIASGYNGTNYKDDDGNNIDVGHARVDPDYLEVLKMKILEGRNFNRNLPTDFTEAILVNETFVKQQNLENPIGQQINFEYGDFKKPTIIGVVKDFNFESLHTNVSPMLLYMGKELLTYNTYIKTSGVNPQILQQIEDVHRAHFSPYPLSYTFLEDDITKQYELETSIQKIAQVGSIAAIFLSCVGLLGFVGTQVRQKMKEVSIRKAVGADGNHIFSLFAQKYIVLLSLGIIIGMTCAFYFISSWLDNFAEHIEFGLDIVSISIAVVILVAALTIFSQLYRAIKLNPVKYLKEE